MPSVHRPQYFTKLVLDRAQRMLPRAMGTAVLAVTSSSLLLAQSSSGPTTVVERPTPTTTVASAPSTTGASTPAPAPPPAPVRRNLPPFVAPFLVTGKGVTIVEFAMRQTDVRSTRRHDVGHLTYRYGVAPRVELRAVVKPYSRVVSGAVPQEGFNGIEVGTRVQLIKRARGYFNPIPRLALQLGTTIPTGADRGPAPTMVLPSAGLATNWRLGPSDVLIGGATLGSAAVRGERRSVQNGFLVHFHHFSPDLMLSSDWLWRSQPDAAMLHHARVGLIYAVRPKVQVEARYVHGLNGITNDRGIVAGFAIRP